MRDATVELAETRVWAGANVVLIVIAGAALMTAAAKVQIPFWPVPMTLQTMAVMAFAVAFGPRIAVSIILSYLAAGAVGLPVFSGTPGRGIGLAYMVGPTGGYMLGYFIASWLVGALASHRNTLGRVVAMLAGLLVIDVIGSAWLAVYVPLNEVITLGVLPFLLGDLLKMSVVAASGVLASTILARFKS